MSSRLFACIFRRRPTRSLVPFVTFETEVPVFNVPEYTRRKVSWPANGSVIILKAKAAKGSLSDGRRFTSRSVFGSIPVTDSTSSGDGRKSTTPSNSCCTPLFLKADPHRIGVIFIEITPARMARRISSSVKGCPLRYFSIACSSNSATASSILSRYSLARPSRSAGISLTTYLAPSVSSSYT